MDLYTFSLALGGVGMASMAVTGLARGHGGHAAGARHGHHGAQHGHHHTAHGHVHGHAHTMHAARETASRALWTLISPRVLFSALVGFGATGLLARGVLGGAPLFLAAVAGGAVFERLLVTPLWNFSLRFASAPALTLESCLADEARAVTAFDARGHGLIAVELDGQVVQVLGTLTAAEVAAGRRIRAGDRLRVEDVDGARNRCTVSYLGA